MAKYQIPVVKGKSAVEIDSDSLPVEVYAEALKLGLKELVNRGMSKITGKSHPDEEARKAEAMKVAAENVEKINSGKIKFAGGAAKKASGAVMTEARRLAKNVIKDELKKAGHKLSHIDASEITKYANALLASERGDQFVEQAKAEIAKREAIAAGIEQDAPATIADILGMVKINPDKKAKAEKAAADKKAKAKPKAAGQLSAKQAGQTKVAPRAKPAPAPQATA